MKSIAVMSPNHLDVVEIEKPKLKPCTALVKTIAAGICGSDAKIIHGTFKDIHSYPCLLGHEAVGRVVEVDPLCTAFKPGDLVMLPYHMSDLPEGMSSFWGGFSEYGLVYDYEAMIRNGMGPGTKDWFDFYYVMRKLPDDFDPIDGVMLITLREVFAACKHFGFSANQTIAIFGAGPVGLAFVKFCKLLGMTKVICVDIVDDKREEALGQGADHFINSKCVDVVKAVRELCPDGVDYVLDAVGINALINTAMELIRDNGQIKVYGVSPKLDMQMDWSKAPYNWSVELFQFPIKYNEGAVTDQLVNWIQNGYLKPKDFVSHVFPFEQWRDGFEIMEKRLPSKKMVIRFE